MRMILPLLAAGLLTAPAIAADTPAKKPSQAQLKGAQETLSFIVSALNSKDVPVEMKNGLFGCLYENPLGKISNARDDVLAKNKGKIDASNPTQQLIVVAEICGAPVPKPADKSAGKPAAKPKGR